LKRHPDFPKEHIINYKLAFSPPYPTFWEDLVNTIHYSISNIAFGRFFTEFISGSGLSTFFTILENIIGVVLISLFILAMNRKFRRMKD
jgi:hypothetical protein